MKISVIIPTYKPKGYLWECLDSLYNQTLCKREFEVLLVLNGCDEPYKSEILNYIKQHKELNMNLIHTQNGGVSNARNLALDQMKGKYYTCLDDDDFLSSTCLEEMYRLANEDNIVECYPFGFNDGHPEMQQKYGLTDVYDYCVANNCKTLNTTARKFFSGPCMKLIPTSYVGKRRFNIKFKNGEDCIFMFLISDKIKNIVYTSRNAIYYRRFREGSAVSRKRKKTERIKNSILCMVEYTKIYFSSRYSTYFYLTRILAEIKCLLLILLNK